MNHVGRNAVGSQLMCNLQTLFLREVGNAAHPGAESPERQHRRLARHVGIFIQNFLWLSEENEEVHRLIAHEQALCSNVAGSEICCSRSRSMHKYSIATIGEIERHRLVHSVGFRTLRVYHGNIHLLPHLVERGETLSATIDSLARRKHEDGVDAARIVASALDEIERQEFYLRTVVVYYMSSLCKYFSFRIAKYQSERILLDFQLSISVFINNALCRRRRVPSTLPHAGIPVAEVPGDKLRREHRVVGLVHLRFDRRSEDGNAQGSVINLLNPDFQVWVVIVLGVGEIEHLHPDRPITVEVESLSGCQPVTLPVEQSFALVQVEASDAVGKEISICQIAEIARNIGRLAL